jgi:toxin ParE1/3/4
MMPVEFSPSAWDELCSAVDWYESRSPGLGRRLFECIEDALTEVRRNPSSFPAWKYDGRVRRFVLQTFPYALFYREREQVLEVVAVAHTARKPGYWMHRG